MEIIGHRGAKALAPENTLAGIRFALTRGVDWIEFDVRTTKDGQAVVVHDRTLLRIAGDRGRVDRYSLAEVRLIATRSGEPIPTLNEVLDVIGTKAKINIELKDTASAVPVATAIHQRIVAGRSAADFLVSSLRVKPLRKLQSLDPTIRLAYLHTIWPFRFMTMPGLRLYAVGFFGLIAPRLALRLAKEADLWIYVYTVNHKDIARHFEQRGVDAIITDTPQAFKPLWPIVLRWLLAVMVAIGSLLLISYIV